MIAAKLQVLLLTSLCSLSLSAAPAAPRTPEQDNYYSAISKFWVGEVDRVVVIEAQLPFLKSEFDTKRMPEIQYCYEAQEATEMLVRGLKELVGVGQRKPEEVSATEKAQLELQISCSPN